MDLTAAFLKERRAFARWPKVSDQIETIPLQRDKLYLNGYNPTIIDRNGRLVMCYRYHNGTLATRLAVATLNDAGEVDAQWDQKITGHSIEDPRFFMLSSGQLWLSWVESDWPNTTRCSIRYGALKDNEIAESDRPIYGNNDGDHMEKNWVFFDHDGLMYFIYRTDPQQVIVQWSGQMERELVSPGPRWPYGAIKGGTPPLPFDGKWLRFFHGTLDNEMGLQRRRYYIGACLMNPEPPFEVVAVSKKPIIYGSESDSLSPAERKGCIHWKPKVVFPGGAVARDGHWLLSLGANDCECVIAKITPQDLHL